MDTPGLIICLSSAYICPNNSSVDKYGVTLPEMFLHGSFSVHLITQSERI